MRRVRWRSCMQELAAGGAARGGGDGACEVSVSGLRDEAERECERGRRKERRKRVGWAEKVGSLNRLDRTVQISLRKINGQDSKIGKEFSEKDLFKTRKTF